MQYMSDKIGSEHNYRSVTHNTTGDKYVNIDCMQLSHDPVVVSLSTRSNIGAMEYETSLVLKKAEAEDLLDKLNQVLNGAKVI